MAKELKMSAIDGQNILNNTMSKRQTIDWIFDKLLDENRDVLEHLKQ